MGRMSPVRKQGAQQHAKSVYSHCETAQTLSDTATTGSLAMISEVLNALLLTYLATEYLVASQQSHTPQGRSGGFFRDWKKPRYLLPCSVVLVVNLVERLSGTLGTTISEAFHQFLHVPKIIFAAASYVVVLYYDCRRVHTSLQVWPDFLREVGFAFLYVLPVYPFLAVLISFGFLLVIQIFDFLHLDEQWLNWPIYYGVLYGPFSFVYWRVKEKIIHQRDTLPSTSCGRVLGTGAPDVLYLDTQRRKPPPRTGSFS